MSACVLHGAVPAIQGGLCDAAVLVYDFQTLIAGVLAIGAAWLAARPVWRQLRDSNLQTRIQHRETLASLMREGRDRYARVAKALDDPLTDLDRLTIDPAGGRTAIGAEDAFAIEQRLHGKLDWYLVGLKATEAEEIETAKAALQVALDDLFVTLNDVHWIEYNEQHDEDHSIPDDEWAAIIARSKAAETLAADKGAAARRAARALGDAQSAWLGRLQARIAKLDRDISTAA